MQEAGLPLLAQWQNFTTIMGGAAATLTGLMFIVITLIAGIDVHVPTVNNATAAFNTPTVVHFCSVLLVALILSAPWQAFASISIVLGLLGVGEVAYQITVMRRLRGIAGSQTPMHDWIWYGALPLSAYIILILAAVVLIINPALALAIVSGVMIVLLFNGIRNGWDLLTYLAIDRAHMENKSGDEK